MTTGDPPKAGTRPRSRSSATSLAVIGTVVVGVGAAAAITGSSGGSSGGTTPPTAVRVIANGCKAIATRGAGVALGGSRVATVAHVVAGATDVAVRTPDGREWKAAVVALDPQADVALLDVPGLAQPGARLRELTAGDRGTYVGEAGDHAATVAFTVAKVASIVSEDIYVKGRYARPGYILQASVTHGDSGAGLVRDDGTLGGLVWATSRNTDTEGWGVGVDALRPLLAATPAGAPPAPAVACAP